MTEKRYDGCLICTDIDGTLTDEHGFISDENARAIAHFQQRGGLFTVATGRYPEYICNYSERFVPNTFVVALNGAVVADCITGEEQWFADMPHSAIGEIESVFEQCGRLERVYLNMRKGCPEIAADELYKIDSISTCEGNRLYKLVFTSHEPITAQTRADLEKIAAGRYICEQSWPFGIELYGLGAGKKNAVEWLKNRVGAKKLVCIGDYENDIGMIRCADLGVAVSNAHEAVKNAADIVTASNNESAIARLIEML